MRLIVPEVLSPMMVSVCGHDSHQKVPVPHISVGYSTSSSRSQSVSVNVQSPETPERFGLRLDVYPPPQILQFNWCFSQHALPHHVVGGDAHTGGHPRSTGITPLQHYYVPVLHPCAFGRLPGGAGYTRPTLLRAISHPGREGLLQLLDVSLPPCRRYHPAGGTARLSQNATGPAAFGPSLRPRPPEHVPFEATSAFTRVTAR